ncbi:MAG: isoprenylcysteine carboxylmethyltransferase family protein [Bacteroidetes bacterium]|nr:isoprenylcysteine carboxylmethyltransferase family protein [Bacteroidota bacterium]
MGIKTIELSIFVLCSLAIVFLSRDSLRDRHSYGYYRFFAFEFILLLLLVNYHWWFENPFSLTQILSWLALSASLILVVTGFRLLGFSRAAGAEKIPLVLVQNGVYAHIRHPLYSSLVFLALGTFLKKPSLFSAILLFGASFSLNATARTEENVNAAKFGESYREYMGKTKKMFIPFLY